MVKEQLMTKGKGACTMFQDLYIITTTIPLTQNEQSITFLVYAISKYANGGGSWDEDNFPFMSKCIFHMFIFRMVNRQYITKDFKIPKKILCLGYYNSMYNHIVYGVKLMCKASDYFGVNM